MTGKIASILPPPGSRKGSIVSEDGGTFCFNEADLVGVAFYELNVGDIVEFEPGGDYDMHATSVRVTLKLVTGEPKAEQLIVGAVR